MKIEIVSNDGNLFLTRDGRIMNCPFQPALIVPVPKQNVISMANGQQQEMQVMPTPCGSWCPKFSVMEASPKGTSVYLQCGAETTKFNIEK